MYISEELLNGIQIPLSETYSKNDQLKHFDESEEYDLFISHSYKDKLYITKLYYLFDRCGYNVYIDWIDDKQLDRNTVTPETARLLRARISQCKGLAYIFTASSQESKWCPWELGLGDGLISNVCIFPIVKNKGDGFKGVEYLGLYPYLDYCQDQNKNNEFWINDNNDKNCYCSLKQWLNGAELKKHSI